MPEAEACTGGPQWECAYGAPPVRGQLRQVPEDFCVDEVLGFAPDGEGQHLLLQVEKRQTNTDWLARQLARHAAVKPRAVSYAGLKDRNAVTTQWFSLDLAGAPAPDWESLDLEGVRVLQAAPHRRKLRRGALRGNRFHLRVRGVTGDIPALEQRLAQVQATGVPNYFGEQRFGHGHGNLHRAVALFQGRLRERDRHRRGLCLSAARAFLFNLVLSRRVHEQSWQAVLEGEALMPDGSHGFFVAEHPDAEIEARLRRQEIHPSGPLWGQGRPPVQGAALALEEAVLAAHVTLREGLERAGLRQERRPLRLPIPDLQWRLADTTLELSFFLPAGSFATTVLREIVSTPT